MDPNLVAIGTWTSEDAHLHTPHAGSNTNAGSDSETACASGSSEPTITLHTTANIDASSISETHSNLEASDNEIDSISDRRAQDHVSAVESEYASAPPSLVQDEGSLLNEHHEDNTSSSAHSLYQTILADETDSLASIAFTSGLHRLNLQARISGNADSALERYLANDEDPWTSLPVVTNGPRTCIIVDEDERPDYVSSNPSLSDTATSCRKDNSEKIPPCYQDRVGGFAMYAYLRANDYPWRLLRGRRVGVRDW